MVPNLKYVGQYAIIFVDGLLCVLTFYFWPSELDSYV
jgi:hypothetical protein